MTGRRAVLVTGGARRLGAAIVRSCAARGWDVLLHHGHAPAEAAALADELQRVHGVTVVPIQEDLAHPDAPGRLVEATVRALGRLDAVVSSAAVLHPVPLDAVTPAQWDETHAINLRAPFFLMQAAARHLPHGGGIVQVTDHLAFEVGWPALVSHGVSKAGVTQLVRAMAGALAPRIRVNAVAPGLVLPPDGWTEEDAARFLRHVPLAAEGTPGDVVQAIHYLLDAPYVTGAVLPVDGGRHLLR
jgi:pteridine reductase